MPNNFSTDVKTQRAVIGIALQDEKAAFRVSQLPDSYFTNEECRLILSAIRDLISRNQAPNLANVGRRLKEKGQSCRADEKRCGTASSEDLVECIDAGQILSELKSHIRHLTLAARQRQLCASAQQLLARTTERPLSEEELNELTEEFQQVAFEAAVHDNEPKLRDAKSVMKEVLATINDRFQGKISPYGVGTGFNALDRATTGLHPGQLVIVCGRPGQGKTSFVLDTALCASQDVLVIIFSLEMSAEEIAQRLIAKEATLNLKAVRSGQLVSIDPVVTAAGDLSELNFVIDDSSTLGPAQLRARVREYSVRQKQAVGLVVVDYLQLMSPGRKFDSREREISFISRELKSAAKDLNCPVVVCSQLNRKLEDRKDKRPILADLRESGAIEQDADLVIGLFQPFTYTEDPSDAGNAEAIVLKQRNGPVGTIPLHWDAATTKFWDA